jgi:hypothetical protein
MARPRVYETRRISTAVRLPSELHARLRDEADRRQVSANLLVERAVADYLARLPPIEVSLPTSTPGGHSAN